MSFAVHVLRGAALALASLAPAAHGADCNSLAAAHWLAGEWFAEGGNSTWRETWTPVDPATWQGRGVESSRSDPAKSSAEDLRLVQMGDGVFYVAKVAQNELPVAFRLVECGEERLVFANPAHDFPRRLEYTRLPGDRLAVRVSDGGDQGFTLDFTRVTTSHVYAGEIIADEDARFAAMISADADAMNRWFAADLAYVHSTGQVANREQLIGDIRSGRLRYLVIEPRERHVTFTGAGAAFVTGVARIRAQAGQDTHDFSARYLAIYGHDAGEWRLHAWQSLRLP